MHDNHRNMLKGKMWKWNLIYYILYSFKIFQLSGMTDLSPCHNLPNKNFYHTEIGHWIGHILYNFHG